MGSANEADLEVAEMIAEIEKYIRFLEEGDTIFLETIMDRTSIILKDYHKLKRNY